MSVSKKNRFDSSDVGKRFRYKEGVEEHSDWYSREQGFVIKHVDDYFGYVFDSEDGDTVKGVTSPCGRFSWIVSFSSVEQVDCCDGIKFSWEKSLPSFSPGATKEEVDDMMFYTEPEIKHKQKRNRTTLAEDIRISKLIYKQMIKKVTVTKVFLSDKNKEGIPYAYKNGKNAGKPFTRVSIQTDKTGDDYYSTNALVDSAITKIQVGETKTLKFTEENGFKNFSFPTKDELQAYIDELEAKQ